MTFIFRRGLLALTLVLCVGGIAFALETGKASGAVTIDGTQFPLSFAVETRKDNLFDESKRDVVMVLTDKQLSATKPDDEIGLTVKARRGELVALALRIDGGTLVNVAVSHKALDRLVILPGAWFQYTVGSKPGTGTLKLADRQFEGHSYAVDVEFSAAPGARSATRPVATPSRDAPAPAATPPADRTPK
jgi:hypothetical protein